MQGNETTGGSEDSSCIGFAVPREESAHVMVLTSMQKAT